MDLKYKKGGDAGSKGVKFQVDLLTLFLLKATSTLNNWRLSTENDGAGKFDDVVLEYPEGTILLQAKHKEDKKTKITLEDLLSTNTRKDDFSLPKYFLSYQQIKCRFKVKNLILCTNANFDKSSFKFLNTRSVSPESMLYYEAGDCLLSTFNEDILPDLKNNTKIYLQQCKNKKIDESVINDENLKDFLEHLQFHCNYPSGKDMENVILKQLSILKDNSNVVNETSPSDIYSKMLYWFQQKDGEYLTEVQAKAMFFEIKKDKYWQKLDRYEVFFRNNLEFDSPSQIFCIFGEEGSLLPEIKLYRTLQDIKTVLSINSECNVEELKEILKAFELPKYTFLTIIWYEAMKESLLEQVVTKLKQILSSRRYKKIIFITKSNNELVRQFQELNLKYEIINNCGTFNDLLENTRNKLLKRKIINFQENSFDLEELLATETPENYEAAIKSEVLEKLIKNEEITVGSRVQPLDPRIEYLYFNRTFKRNDEEIEEGAIVDVDEKVILIADGPGMGKTTVLTNLATTMKKKRPHLWVIKLILSDYTKYFKDLKEKNEENVNIAELLDSQTETRLKHQFEKCLFAMNDRVILMLDGVDEVSPNYTELVENLVIHCQQASNIWKIIVTSRPHVIDRLEKKLKTKSFNLQLLTDQNQVDFLVNYWTHNLGLKKLDKVMCELYADELLNKMRLSSYWYFNNSSHFASIPLQLRMLAEIFQERTRSDDVLGWEGCKEFLEREQAMPILPKINFTKLFKMFVDKKRSVYLEKLNPDGNAMIEVSLKRQFNDCLEYHRAQALELILDKQNCEFFTDYKERDSSMESDILNIGILQKIDSGMHFIHRTFAEYFVAECLIRELQCQNRNLEFQKFLIEDILLTDSYIVVRTFLDSFLQDTLNVLPTNSFQEYQHHNVNDRYLGNLMHRLAENGCVAILQLILKNIDFEVIEPTNSEELVPYSRRGKYNIFGKIRDFYRRKRGNALSILRFNVQKDGVDIKNYKDETPLIRAIDAGHLDMVKFLVEQGSNINPNRPPAEMIIVPLYRAVEAGSIDIVKFLMDQGANIKPNSEWDYIILYEAVSGDHHIVAEYLLEKILEVDDSAKNNCYILYTAAYLGRLDMLREGIPANNRIPNGETLLFAAARGGEPHIIQYLVDRGANINHKDDIGNTALHIISKNYKFRATEQLIELGVDINAVNFENETALNIAAAEGSMRTVELLIERGANANTKDGNGKDALYYITKRGNLELVKLLIHDFFSKQYLNALDTAASYGHLDILKYLLTLVDVDDIIKGHCGYRALRVAVAQLHLHIVNFLLDCGVDVNAKNKEEDTLLHSVVRASRFGLVTTNRLIIARLLIKHSIDVNVTDKCGNTALHLVFINFFEDMHIAQVLVDSGVNVNVQNKYGETALHILLKRYNCNYLRLVKELDVDSYDGGLEEMSEAVMVERWTANSHKMSDGVKENLPTFANRLYTVIYLIMHGTDINLKDSRGNTAAALIRKKGGRGGQLLIKYLSLTLHKQK